MKYLSILFACLLASCLYVAVKGDLPVSCMFPQIKGDWTFHLGEAGQSSDIVNKISITDPITTEKAIKMTLSAPNVAVDEYGNNGRWTMIYNQGFEIIINDAKFFAFFNYTQQGSKIISNCDRTFTGYYHELGVAPKNWGAFRGYKNTDGKMFMSSQNVHTIATISAAEESKKFTNNHEIINKINKSQKSWIAKAYPEFDGLKNIDMIRKGGRRESKQEREATNKHMEIMKMIRGTFMKEPKYSLDLPENFDWRNVSGANYVSPVSNQGGCGSCYAFAFMGMFESRMRIKTQLREKPTYSSQDIVSCGKYSQGCDGGFPYLMGKYSEDFGIVTEQCYPYQGKDSECKDGQCKRQFGTDYNYVGGYYGGTSEEAMKEEIYKNGPVVVAIQVYPDFRYYSGGVYKHVKKVDSMDPGFQETNHAVLAVGWGVTPENEKYWIVKNSWGGSWGLNGYILISRGNNEIAIESMAVSTEPANYW